MSVLFRFVGVASVLLATACGDQENTLTAEEAGRALGAYRRALPTGSLDGEIHSCRDGGDLRITKRSGAAEPASLSATLQECRSSGIHVSGDLHVQFPELHLDRNLVDATSIIKEHNQGKLTFRGEVSGKCEVDVHIATPIIDPKKSTVTGKFCGHDAAKLPKPQA